MFNIHASVYGECWSDHRFLQHAASDPNEVSDFLYHHIGEDCATAFSGTPPNQQAHFDYGYEAPGGRSLVFVRLAA